MSYQELGQELSEPGDYPIPDCKLTEIRNQILETFATKLKPNAKENPRMPLMRRKLRFQQVFEVLRDETLPPACPLSMYS